MIVEPVQVMVHLPENWTKILLVRTYGLGLADGGSYWEIPTEIIPAPLRVIGSRFVIKIRFGEFRNATLRGREAWHENLEVMPLPEMDRNLWQKCNERTD